MKSLYIFCLLLIGYTAFPQLPVSLELHQKLEEVNDLERVPVFIQGTESEINQFLSEIRQKPLYQTQRGMRSQLTKEQIKEAANYDIKLFGGGKGQLLNDSVRIQNCAIAVHSGANIDQAYKGKGVIVGILDSGLDYRHPDFYDNDGHSRVFSIWDQRMTGNAPNPYNYGYECDSLSIANQSCPSFDQDWLTYDSHGTHVAGTAAAYDQVDGSFTGMAPEATIIGVALDFSNFFTAVLDGAKYVYDIAQEKGMPAVINLSAGFYSGSHDGKDVFTLALDDLLIEEPGRAFVTSAGNAGRLFFNARHVVEADEQFTYFKSRGSGDNLNFSWTIYADEAEFENVDFQVQVDQKSDLTELGATAVLNILEDFPDPGNNTIQEDIQVFDTNGGLLGNLTILIEKYNGVYGLFFIATEVSSAHYWRFNTSGDGLVDIYAESVTNTSKMVLETELPSDFSEINAYTSPTKSQNIIGYFGASEKVITVGNYVSKNTWVRYDGDIALSEIHTIGEINESSSIGPTRDGRIKPEVSSTGTFVTSAANEDYINWHINNGTRYGRIHPDGMHFRFGGTSMSSPAVAGGIALLLERSPDLTIDEIRDLVINNTVRDDFTGPNENNVYGYGKFCAFDIMVADGAQDGTDINTAISVLPNTGIQGERLMRTIVDVKEIFGLQTDPNNEIIITVTANPNYTITWDETATEIAGESNLENSLWVFDDSLAQSGLWIFRRVKDENGLTIPIGANQISKFGFLGTWNAGASGGKTAINATVLNFSGGEINTINNSDNANINYLPEE